MKKFLLPALLLTAVGCGQVQSQENNLADTNENVFKSFNWDKDSGMKLERTATDGTIYQDADLSFYSVGETKDGKMLHNLDITVMSHAQHHEMGDIEDEFSDLQCIKTKVRSGFKLFVKVTCENVDTTDQRDEILFGAPQVKLVMIQQKNNKIDATLTVDRGFEEQTVKLKGLNANRELYYGAGETDGEGEGNSEG